MTFLIPTTVCACLSLSVCVCVLITSKSSSRSRPKPVLCSFSTHIHTGLPPTPQNTYTTRLAGLHEAHRRGKEKKQIKSTKEILIGKEICIPGLGNVERFGFS
ncbi:hypothetical protein M406DRAFT_354423 [Cryphonectria parasitica EP155]|uniref:Secreted protein n=1 Tax=Cryphonectria parasitica (strain ATCC 38755 / EP155) TaxID=660469 RepID=A0A9P5CUY1_CRYP1|nr:uncharacterized protein M406DRAFT_354423 [Cryphonectria parasitica EP155]KAF3770390.1 hypothetical protein M406DRAFT_354423 [Cryphonectria parasitica EP155]